MVRLLITMLLSTAIMTRESYACLYTCLTPNNEKYCCDSNLDKLIPPETHPGTCPITRPECPDVRTGTETPRLCPHDGLCDKTSKCCYDVCLEHHVCKPVLNVPIIFPEEP
ncbi:uncharacterized protein [Macrobrachium rosenbergii]|uniref:uncharacterized protein n=1 Tax=Macrobrachium rosenbergii TaxID=79674 RepID=UPI0034D60775